MSTPLEGDCDVGLLEGLGVQGLPPNEYAAGRRLRRENRDCDREDGDHDSE